MFVLVICKILGNLVKTLTADDKYSLHNSEILWQPIQIQLSKKKNDLFLILFFISEIYINVLTFGKKKHGSHSLHLSEITECESRA